MLYAEGYLYIIHTNDASQEDEVQKRRVPSRQPYTGRRGGTRGTRARTGLWGSIKKSHVLHLRVVRGRDAPHHRRELLPRRRLVQCINVISLDHIFYGILPQDAGRELLAQRVFDLEWIRGVRSRGHVRVDGTRRSLQ